MEFNPYRRYAMMITVEMITDDYTAVYTIFSEAVNRSQVFIERKIMNLEKKYRIIKISFILVSCLFFIVLYAIGTYVSERKEEHRFAKGIRGTYTSADSFTNISLDDEDQLYYLSGDRVSHGTYKKLNEQVFKLLSGHLRMPTSLRIPMAISFLSNRIHLPPDLKNTIIKLPLYQNEKSKLHDCMRMLPQTACRRRYLLFCLQLFLYDLESVDMNCKPLLIRV